MKTEEVESTMNNLEYHIHQYCKKHKSEIGGLCNDINCLDNNQMKCALCVADDDCCIRKNNHSFIPIGEFVNLIFTNYYADLKNNFNSSTEVNKAENYCFSSQVFIDKFNEQRKQIIESFDILCYNLTEHIKKIINEFKDYINDIFDKRHSQLKETFLALDTVLYYTDLEQFDLFKLNRHMHKMPYESINLALLKMKKLILNLRSNHHIQYNNKIRELTCINSDKYIQMLGENFDKLHNDITDTFNSFKKEIEENLFKEEIHEFKGIKQMKTLYDQYIDFSANSNFCDKKFVIYKSIINNKTFLVYPSSLNQIKIEDFTEHVLSLEEKKEFTSNEVLHIDFHPNARDNLLYFKLKGHSNRINHLLYFPYLPQQKEFLVTSSDDLKIKVWNLSAIHQYLNKSDEYHKKISNVKTLVGHKNKIIDVSIYFNKTNNNNEDDSNENIPYIISISLQEKIQVWNLLTGEILFDLFDRLSIYKGSYETIARGFYIHNMNYLVTANNSNNSIKFWDMDKKVVLYSFKYLNDKMNIVEILFSKKRNSIILVDNKGSCAICKIPEKEQPIMLNMNINSFKTERVGSFFYDENTLLFYSANGLLSLYDLNSTSYREKRMISEEKITHCCCLEDKENERKLICCHLTNQKFQIYG